jgi:TetR/AcrR family transcriptional regulator
MSPGLLAEESRPRAQILEQTIHLFAAAGFAGVSMRRVAEHVGVTPAALYHHFADKEQLYLATVKYAFRDKTAAAQKIVAAAGDPFASLEAFLLWFAQTLAREGNFRKLLQWVFLDADPDRTRQLVQETFSELFAAIQQLADSFKSRYDPHLLSISIISLVAFHYQTQDARKLLPGNRASHDKPATVARHVADLLRHGLGVPA